MLLINGFDSQIKESCPQVTHLLLAQAGGGAGQTGPDWLNQGLPSTGQHRAGIFLHLAVLRAADDTLIPFGTLATGPEPEAVFATATPAGGGCRSGHSVAKIERTPEGVRVQLNSRDTLEKVYELT